MPFSAKNFSAPGWNGTEEFASFWFSGVMSAGVNGELIRRNDRGAYPTALNAISTALECSVAVTPGEPVHVEVAVTDRWDSALE